MLSSLPAILEIFIYLGIGFILRKTNVLGKQEIEGFKKILLKAILPAILFLAFSRTEFNLNLIPLILGVFLLNILAFLSAVGIRKKTDKIERSFPLYATTFNMVMIGIPLYQALYGADNLHHYVTLGIGNEIFVWMIFAFIAPRYLGSEGTSESGFTAFFRMPVVWGIILGSIVSITGIDFSVIDNVLLKGTYNSLAGLAGAGSPLILIYVGFSVVISRELMKTSLKFFILRLMIIMGIGMLMKVFFFSRFIAPSEYFNAAFFLLIILPPMFNLSLIGGSRITDEEESVLGNTIVFHCLMTIVLFSVYALFSAI